MSLFQTVLAALSPFEIVAALFSLASVVLTARQNIFNFPVGIVACLLYIWVFKGAKLYADAGLQVFFIGVCLWDWNQWARGAARHDLRVTRTPALTWVALGALFLVGTASQGFLLGRYTDAAAPFVDSGIFWASVGAQWMIGRKYVENWLVWIGVDVVATVLYWSKGLPVTSVLYALFCLLVTWGWIEWRRSQTASQLDLIAPRPDAPPLASP